MNPRILLLALMLLLSTACTSLQDVDEVSAYPDENPRLAPTFTLVTWNVAKGAKSSTPEIAETIIKLTEGSPSSLVALQEATPKMLSIPGRGADFARSFRWWWSDTLSGVALLSSTPPMTTHPITVAQREFGYTTPKMGLAAVYPVADRNGKTHRLLVITLHGLNFELSPGGLSAQMEKIHERVSPFKGPVVICGDFNTWSNQRLAVVKKALPHFMEIPVTGKRPGTSPLVALIGGNTQLALDHIFYRGLTPRGPATAFPTPLSDHAPVMARFTLP
ncbi:endonuclease/exonuclease/phosphatase family protein [Desulfoluna sp.]|uniref:endonuclease/exonuclease/phosphatase family protein n=1 Tax=Desulfoluna sp. TaxID=2045199 RepID=UPI002603FC73|nr:endonuclease/exonuclease/phosphatase family protein [Desulfoluna sp.]